MNKNFFHNIISNDIKQLYSNAITELLSNRGFAVPCVFEYSGEDNTVFCNNCEYDTIAKLSSNIYKTGGPSPFTNGTICPVCMGMGLKKSDKTETINMVVLFDSKFFMNLPSNIVNIADGMAQTICEIKFLPKIRNANSVVFDTNISEYGNYRYIRAGDPMPLGLGENKFIITTWQRQ